MTRELPGAVVYQPYLRSSDHDERLRRVLDLAADPADPPVETERAETLLENYEPAGRLRPDEARLHRYNGTQ